MGGEGEVQLLLIKDFQLINVEGMREMRNHHLDTLAINCYRREPLMNAKIIEQNMKNKIFA